MYGLLAVSIRPPSKSLLPIGMSIFTLIGLLTAEGISYRYTQSLLDQENNMGSQQEDIVRNSKWICGILGLVVLYARTSVSTKESPQSITQAKSESKTPPKISWSIRSLVKLGAVLQIITAISVIGMGLSTRNPNDLMGNLIWVGPYGYRYDVFQTFGEETVLSFAFIYLLLLTMMSTIFQTLFVGLWVLMYPISSDATSEGLTAGLVVVPLIILANRMAMRIYDQDFGGFEAGKECMVGHIALLVKANIYIPIIWVFYHIARWRGGPSVASWEKKKD